MATYSIPKDFIEGFDGIINMPEEDFQTLVSLIGELQIGEPFGDFLDKSADKFSVTSPKEVQVIVQSLVSIVGIFENANGDIDEFTSDFSRSYLISKENATETQKSILKNRLSSVLDKFSNLSITVKGQDLLTDNQRNFREGRVITDIRLMFDNNLSSPNTNALIVHNLKIQYQEDRKTKEFFVALDLSDLKKLKSIVDRAIEKDRIIKETQKNFSFLDYNN